MHESLCEDALEIFQEIIASDGQNALQKAEQRRSDGPLGDAIQNMLKYDVGYFSMFNL